MKRFLMLGLVLLCLGTGSQALAAPFGNFDTKDWLETNVSNIFPDSILIGGFDKSMLEQKFYFQAIFAADSVIDADSKFFNTGGTEFAFADIASAWGTGNAADTIADMTLSHKGNTYKFSDLIIDIQLYVGEEVAYKPEADLDSAIIIEGGSYFVSFSIPGSTSKFDFAFVLAPNPIEFRSTPAPAALILFGTGLAGIFATRRRVKN